MSTGSEISMRFLHLADLHIGKKVHGYSMLQEQEHILLEEVMKVIDEQHVEMLCIAGDIYDTSVPSGQAVTLFDGFLTKLSERKVKTYIIPGNHDSAERISFASEILKQNQICVSKPLNYELDNATLEKYVEQDEYGNINIYLMPYLRCEDVKKIIDNTKINLLERNILVAHQFVTGQGSDNELSDSETKNIGGLDDVDVSLFKNFDYVALGHLHAPQRVGRDTVRYAGSILKYSFSETEQKKSFTIVDMEEKGDVVISNIPIIPIHDMRKIRGPIDKLLDENVYKEGNVDDYLQITLTDEDEVFDAARRLKMVYCNMLKLDFDNSRIRAYNQVENIENIEHKSDMELFCEFYKNRTDTELNEKEMSVISNILQG